MKKFVDQAWLEQPWFDALTPQQKLAWYYVWTKCDLVGVWSGNTKIANIQIGYEIKWEAFRKALGSKIKLLEDGRWWLTEYCPFQFGNFSPESRVHMAAKRELNRHGVKDEDSLWIGYPEATRSLKYNTNTSTRKESAERKPKTDILPIPPNSLLSVPEFETAWKEFIQHRREIKKPLTPTGANQLLKTLSERPKQAARGLETAIRNRWQGFNWEWVDGQAKKGGSNGHHTSTGDGMFLSR